MSRAWARHPRPRRPPIPPPPRAQRRRGRAASASTSTRAPACCCRRAPRAVARAAARPRHRQHPVRKRQHRARRCSAAKRWFVRFGIERRGRAASTRSAHDYDAAGRDVLIQFPVGTLGDMLAWFPYAVRFAERHGCRLTCAMSGLIIPLLRDAYPAHRLRHARGASSSCRQRSTPPTASACSSTTRRTDWQPTDFRHVGLHRTAGYILGVDPAEEPPRLALPDESRPIAEPYVVHRRAKQQRLQVLEQPERLARGRRASCKARAATG